MLLLFWQFNIQRIVRRHLLSYLQLHQNIDRFSTLFYWYASKFAINLLIKSLPHLKRVWLIVTRQCNGAFEMQLQWDLQRSLYCKCTDEFASETRTATRSRRTRKRAFHFCSPGVVRRSHVAARQLSALLYCMSAPLPLCRRRCCPCCCVGIGKSMIKIDYYSRPSGVCRYGRLFYFACVFYFFFYLTNLRKNGQSLFGAKYGRT